LFEKIKQTKTYTNKQATPTALFEKQNKTKSNKQRAPTALFEKQNKQINIKNK